MALTRVQATPKATVTGTTFTLTFPAPPTVGNGIVVEVVSFAAAFPATALKDNWGNVYKQAITRLNSRGAAIYYCEAVAFTGASFTITFGPSTSTRYVGVAIEVGGLGGSPLSHTSISGAATSAAPNTGATAALPKDEVFLAAAFATGVTQTTITVVAESPVWQEEFEDLTTTTVPSEADTRVVTGVVGTTPSCSWAVTGSSAWAAVLSAFWPDPSREVVHVADPVAVTESPRVIPGLLSVRVADAIQLWDLTKPPTPAPWTVIGTFTGAPGLRGGTVGGGIYGTWNTTGADLLVVCVFFYWGYYSAPTITLTDNKGNAWVGLSLQHAPGSNPDPGLRFFYAKNAKVGGDHRFTLNTGNAELSPNVIVYAFSGSHLTEPHDIEGGGSTFTSLEESVTLASVTPWSDGALVVSAFTNPTQTAITGLTATPAMTVTTAPGVQGVSLRGAAGWLVQGVSAPVSPTWTWTGPSAGTAAMAVFRAANTQGVEPDRQMVRVQATPKNRSIPLTLTFPSPPTVGNGIVVYASTYIENNPFTQAAARDNYGNYYRLAATKHNAAPVVALYYCEQIQRTGSPFIITLTHTAGYGENLGAATEVTGVGTGLVLHQTAISATMVGNKLTAGPTPPVTVDEVFVAATMNHYTDSGSDRYVNVVRPPWVMEFTELGTGEGDTRGVVRATGTTQSVQWTIVGESGSWPVGALAAFGRGTQLRVAVYEAVTIAEKAASSPMSIRIIERVFVDDVSIPPARTLRRRQGITYYTPGQYNVEAGLASFTIELPTHPLVGNGLLVLVSVRRWNTALNLKVTDNLKNEYQVVQVIGASSVGAALAYATVRTTGSAYLVTVSSPGDNNAFWAVTILEVQNDLGLGLTLDRSATATGSGTAIAVGPTPAHGADEVFTAAAMATNGVYQSALTVQTADPRWREEHETRGIMGYWGYEVAGEANTQYLSRVGPRGVATTSAAWTASVSGSWAAVVASFTGQTLQVTVADTITTRESWKATRSPLMRAVFDTVATSEFIGDPQRLLFRERGAFNKVVSDNQGEHGVLTLNPPPAVGNGLAILVSVEWANDDFPLSCTDTYGNLYRAEAEQQDSAGRVKAAVFSTQVLATGPGFTITVAGVDDDDWWPSWVLSAVEISNPEGLGISRDAAAMATGTSTTPSVSLPALQAAETLLVAVCTYRSNQTSLTVNTVPPTEPPWIQEHEELTRNDYCVGEGDTRIVRAPGVPQTVTWTGSASAVWVAVLVAFQGVNLNAIVTETVTVIDARTPFLYPIPVDRKVWDIITRTEAVTLQDGRNTKTTGADPLKVTDAVSLFFGSPTLLEVRVGEYITTRELTPKEPPSSSTGQDQTFPSGYELKVYPTDILRYTGPWPTGDWTASFWAQHHGQWRLFRDVNNFSVWIYGLRQTAGNMTLGLQASSTAGGSNFLDLLPHDLAWHHFAVVHESGTLRVFIDGKQRNTPLTLSGGGALYPTVDEQFGPYQTQYMTGPHRVAYYRMWDAALTAADLAPERQARTAVRTTNLWRDTPLEASLLDVSGQARHWGVGGAAVPIIGPSPLPWVADALTVQDVAAVTVQARHERYRVELVGARDVLRVQGGLGLQLVETLRVGETGVAAPPSTGTAIKTYRWYTTAVNATFNPVGVGRWPKGGWHHIYGEEAYLQYAGAYKLTHRFRATTPSSVSQYGYFYNAFVGETFFLHSFVSDPLPAQVLAGAFNLCQLAGDTQSYSYPPQQGPRLNFKLYMYVSVGSTDAVRGVLLDHVASDTHLWPQFYTNDTGIASTRWWSLPGDATLTPLVIQPGDRIILVYGYSTRRVITTHSFGHHWALSGYPQDAVPQNSYTINTSPPLMNSWVEFKSGILAYAAEKAAVEPVTVTEQLVQRIQILTLTVAETITVETGLLFPIRDFGVAQPVTVTDAIMRRLFDPPLTVSVSETIGHTEATSGLFAIPPPVITGIKLGVMEVIHVEEYRLRAVSTTVMTIVAYEYVYVREREQMAAFPLVWDGSGAPPAPATIAGDYWKDGI